MSKCICVYCSSSNNIDKIYMDEAVYVGEILAKRGYTLVYGGGNVGLMGKVALTMQSCGGKVIGVIPERLVEREVVHRSCDELIITNTMRERKAVMDEKSDAFIALPGGFGTLDEILEAITIRQLGFHQKPIIFLNTHRFYDHLFSFFNQLFEERFADRKMSSYFSIAKNIEEALDIIEASSEKL